VVAFDEYTKQQNVLSEDTIGSGAGLSLVRIQEVIQKLRENFQTFTSECGILPRIGSVR
jgi:hypothetical protein